MKTDRNGGRRLATALTAMIATTTAIILASAVAEFAVSSSRERVEALPTPALALGLEEGQPHDQGDVQPEIGDTILGAVPELVYSNTNHIGLFRPGEHIQIADDIIVAPSCGCNLTSYEIIVGGNGDGTGPGFSVDYAMYDACPSSGGQIIPGTEGSAILPDDGDHTVVFQNAGNPLTIPRSFWLAVEFDRDGVGWRAGSDPELGFSEDLYDLPEIPCSAAFAPSFPASFALQIFCEPVGPPNVFSPDPPSGGVNALPTTELTWNGQSGGSTSGVASAGSPLGNNGLQDEDIGHEEAIRALDAAVKVGEIDDPRKRVLPEVAPRTYFGPGGGDGVAGGSVPEVTPADIFIYEDSSDLLVTNFSSGQLFDLMSDATNDMIATHGDNFDFSAFFLNFVPDHQIGGAFYLAVENDVQGIGKTIFNSRPSYGLAGDNIEGFVMMWNQANWSLSLFTSTQLILGQEFEHRFGVSLAPLSGGRSLQGDQSSCGRFGHWNFSVDGQASGMEIREWTGSSPATRLSGTLNFNTDIGGVFSYPDLYLMGYVLGNEMDSLSSELRYMDDSCATPYFGPISNWSSADVEATNGVRIPNAFNAQQHFSTGWIMIHRPNATPTASQINRAVTILNNWSEMYEMSTINRGTMSNVLDPGAGPNPCAESFDVLLGTTNPPTQVVCQGTTVPVCDPGPLPLEEDTTYFWQVIGTNVNGTQAGPIWSFSTVGVGSPDCNNNGIADLIDIESEFSDDCNLNSIPDECEPDGDGDTVPDDCDVCPGFDDNVDGDGDGLADGCDPCPIDFLNDSDGDGVCNSVDICPGGDDNVEGDGDGVPDFCDPCPLDNPDDPDGDGVCTADDNCELFNPGQLDCQPNGVGDVCDIASKSSNDDNGDGIPDECVILPVLPESCVDCAVTNPPDCSNCPATCPTGCPLDGDGCQNESVLIGGVCYAPKHRYLSMDSNPGNASFMTARRLRVQTGKDTVGLGWVASPVLENGIFVAAVSQVAVFRDWSADPTVHLSDCHIVTGRTYLIDVTSNGVDFSTELALPTTGQWGDVVGAVNAGLAAPPQGVANLSDAQAIVKGFQGSGQAPLIWLDLEPEIPNRVINLIDASRSVKGFQGEPYPFSDPCVCAGLSPCP